MGEFIKTREVPASELKAGMRFMFSPYGHRNEEISFVEVADDNFMFFKTKLLRSGFLPKNNIIPIFMYEYEDYSYYKPIRSIDGNILGLRRLHDQELVDRIKELGRTKFLLPLKIAV